MPSDFPSGDQRNDPVPIFREIRNWAPRGTIQRLQPEIFHAVCPNRIDQALAVRLESQRWLHARIRIDHPYLRLGACIQR